MKKTIMIVIIFMLALSINAYAQKAKKADKPMMHGKHHTMDHSKHAHHQKAKKGLSESGEMQLSEEDRCPVCAMKVVNNPKFASAIELADGTVFYFCGTGCMIKSWLHPEIFLGTDKKNIKRLVVHDYFTGKPLDAMKAIWVAGSDVIGPMGPALVPLKNEKDLETFKKRHGGKTVFKLSDMTDEKWEAITGKKATPPK